MLAEIRAALPRRVLNPIVRVMAQIGITPNMLSWFGLILSVAAGGLAGVGYLMWAGWVSLIAGRTGYVRWRPRQDNGPGYAFWRGARLQPRPLW